MGRCRKASSDLHRGKGTGISENVYYQGTKYENQAVGNDLTRKIEGS